MADKASPRSRQLGLRRGRTRNAIAASYRPTVGGWICPLWLALGWSDKLFTSNRLIANTATGARHTQLPACGNCASWLAGARGWMDGRTGGWMAGWKERQLELKLKLKLKVRPRPDEACLERSQVVIRAQSEPSELAAVRRLSAGESSPTNIGGKICDPIWRPT